MPPIEEPTEPTAVTPTGRDIAPTFTNSLDMEFVRIPAGEFQMGSSSEEIERLVQRYGEDARIYFERGIPQHQVTISQPFYLGKYPVTQGQWQAVMGSNPSNHTGDLNRPVESVFWDDAQTFIQKLNERESGKQYRLPTEAEWEYACRAGTTTAYSFGDDPGQLGEYAWYKGNAGDKTHPVGQLKPNAWGLYDMHGNVSEWVQDRYGSDYYQESPDTDPQGPSQGKSRVLRGGSFLFFQRFVRCAYRYVYYPQRRFDSAGFRVVLLP